jgi:hypothetical protein
MLPSFVDQLVRLTTAFNRILRLSGTTVQSAAFTEQGLGPERSAEPAPGSPATAH